MVTDYQDGNHLKNCICCGNKFAIFYRNKTLYTINILEKPIGRHFNLNGVIFNLIT